MLQLSDVKMSKVSNFIPVHGSALIVCITSVMFLYFLFIPINRVTFHDVT